MQRDYETMIVLRADLPEGGIKEQLERLTKVLEEQGATVRGVHEWGLRQLAYLVAKERRGFYALLEYTGEATALLELERQMKLSDLVLRYVSLRQEHPVEVATPTADAASGTPSTPSTPSETSSETSPAAATGAAPEGSSTDAPATPLEPAKNPENEAGNEAGS